MIRNFGVILLRLLRRRVAMENTSFYKSMMPVLYLFWAVETRWEGDTRKQKQEYIACLLLIGCAR